MNSDENIQNEVVQVEKKEKKDRKIKEEKKEESNFQDFKSLVKEFRTNKMPERKRIALRVKLISLFLENKILDSELDLMISILGKERAKGVILSKDEYLLNEIENAKCVDKCIVISDTTPQSHRLHKDMICNFVYNSDEDRYIVYVPRVIPSEFQYSKAAILKINLGHPVPEELIPPQKKLLKRLNLSAREFGVWFQVVDDEILSNENSINKINEQAFEF